MPFENDDALDWLNELEAGGADVIRRALTKANDGYVDAPEGSIAVAAADITAACQGYGSGDLPETLPTGWPRTGPSTPPRTWSWHWKQLAGWPGRNPNWPSCGRRRRT